MIVGTAGHIDHGKTTLVRALTGVDTDRLPEEKKRGISIELGYAFLDTPAGERIGFIDVPGHERLVHTMISGATGIDHALLLVAADDGVMPQTREHLAVLSLLDIDRGAVVITKADRVDATRSAEVRDDAAALLHGTPLSGAGVRGGRHARRRHRSTPAMAIRTAALPRIANESDEAFRLAIDRAFTLDGVGTVVTGTVHAGSVAIGDDLQIVPSVRDARVRVRSLHAQNRAVTEASAGQRCAVALVGVSKEAIERGQWLTSPDVALATDRLDASITLWRGEAKALRAGTPVHVHVGASDTPGSVALLDAGDALAPGGTARVQLVLQRAIAAWRGERVVLRDTSASRTIAGGRVLDPFAPARYRRTPQRIAVLTALAARDPTTRLHQLATASAQGVDLQQWARAEGLHRDALPALPADALCVSTDGAPCWMLAALWTRAARDATLAALRDYHLSPGEELGPDAARLRRLALPKLGEPLWRALLSGLITEAQVAQRGAFVHLPEHGVRLSATEQRIAQKVAAPLAAASLGGAWVRDLARDTQESEPLVRTTLARLAQRGELHQVVRDLFYPPQTIQRMATIARDLGAAAGAEVTAARFRDATQLGRKRAIQVLEYFDRVGLLRRTGDVHKLRSDTDLFKESV
jgi:selenocysteine-specific elongation factor